MGGHTHDNLAQPVLLERQPLDFARDKGDGFSAADFQRRERPGQRPRYVADRQTDAPAADIERQHARR